MATITYDTSAFNATITTGQVTAAAPEPTTGMLAGLSLFGLGALTRRLRHARQ